MGQLDQECPSECFRNLSSALPFRKELFRFALEGFDAAVGLGFALGA